MIKEDILSHFHVLADYFEKIGRVENKSGFKTDFPAFFLHSIHMKAYEFVVPYCCDKKVLDVGCSLGTGEFVLADSVERIVAVDMNEEALEFASRSIDRENVEFMKADARELPFEKESFDVVIAFQLIEHIQPIQVKAFLLEISRVVKPGGLCLIVTPNRKFRLLPFQSPFFGEHYQEFTVRNLRKALVPVFNEVQIKGTRAVEWLEEIEKNRSRKSLYEVYIKNPSLRLKKILVRAKKKIMPRPLMVSNKRPVSVRDVASGNSEEFERLFEKFEVDDIFLQDNLLDKSINLFAVCKK